MGEILNVKEQAKDHVIGHVVSAKVFLPVYAINFSNKLTISPSVG